MKVPKNVKPLASFHVLQADVQTCWNMNVETTRNCFEITEITLMGVTTSDDNEYKVAGDAKCN